MTLRLDVLPLTIAAVLGFAAAQNNLHNFSPLLIQAIAIGGGAFGTVLWLYSPLPNTNGGIADPGGFHRQQWGFTTKRPQGREK